VLPLVLSAAALCSSRGRAQQESPQQDRPQQGTVSSSAPQATPPPQPETPETDRPKTEPSQSAPVSAESVPGVNAFAGQKVTGVRFGGVTSDMLDPLPAQLELQPGQQLDPTKVRASLRRLYASGLYQSLAVEGMQAAGGVVVVFRGEPRLFLGRTQIFGIKSEQLRTQLVASERLLPGTRYTQRKLDTSLASIRQALTENGYHQAKVERRVQVDQVNQQVNVIYNITPGTVARIGDVKVEGTPGLSLEEFRKASGLKPDKKVDRDTVSRALTRLRKRYDKKQRWAGSVTLQQETYDPARNRLDYTFHATEGPLVQVKVEGARYKRATIERLIPIYEEGTIDLDLVNEGAHNLRTDLQGKGYFDATVTHQPVHNGPSEVTVLYKVDRGAIHRVNSVKIEGGKYFDEDTLEEHTAVRSANFVERHGTYSQALIDSDVDNLTALYQGNGFSHVSVTPEVHDVDTTDKKGKTAATIDVVYKIVEGEQQKIGRYDITGANQVPLSELRPLLNTEMGQPYSSVNVIGDRDVIQSFYLSRGFQNIQVKVVQHTDPKNPGLVDVAMDLNEGEKISVDKVLVSGLHYTRPTTVEPRVTLRPDQPLDQTALLDSQRKLYNLALFNEVNTAIQNPNGEQLHKNVLLQTSEAKRWDVTYGFGFQAQTGTPFRSNPSPAFLIQQGINPNTFNASNGHFGVSPNFIFDVSRINLRGKNESVTLRTNYGTLEQQAVVLYQDPNLFRSPTFSSSLSGGYTSSQNVTTFSASSLFATERVTHHVTKASTLIYSFSYREVRVNSSSLQVSLGLIPLLSQPARVGGPGLNYIRDTRDDALDAHRGTFNNVQLFLSDGIFGSQANFSRIDFTNASYYTFGKRKWVFARETRYGQERAFGNGNQLLIPLPERLYGGGATSHRGFAINATGPRDPQTGFPLGGAAAFINTFELRTPYPNLPLVGNNLGFVLFHDAGNTFARSRDVFPSFLHFHQPNEAGCRTLPTVSTNLNGTLNIVEAPCNFNYWSHAIGVGARYRTPIGPIRVDTSYNLDPPSYPIVYNYQGSTSNVPQPQTGQAGHFNFFFSIGQTF
jgi:outer membrane protein insertion porin family